MRLLLFAVLSSFLSIGQAQDSKVIVFLNSKADKTKLSEEATAELMAKHLANIEKLVEEGKLLVAGPMDGGGGIFIFNTEDLSLTKKWLQSDPAVRAGRWHIEIFKISFDKGGACLVGQPYEMVKYNFLRVNYINEIANYKLNSPMITGWEAAAEADSVLAVGRFPQQDGGFIVYKGDIADWQTEFTTNQTSLVLMKLWVARGAFCE